MADEHIHIKEMIDKTEIAELIIFIDMCEKTAYLDDKNICVIRKLIKYYINRL